MERYLTLIPLLAAAVSIVYYALSNRSESFLRQARSFFYLSAYTIVVLFAYFLYLIISHQYQYTYVWSYSANNLSTPLLISTSYAGQEGSFFLWTFYVAVIGIFLIRYSKKHDYERIVTPILLLFVVFILSILTLKSPFAKVWETYNNVPVGTTPQDGRGLNPLLQNFWIVIHPPILFLGFATAIVPFAYAVAGLVKKDYLNWTSYVQPWLVLNILTLGAGIIIGGYWAYITLGWGGFWGWDPVENSSLIPWLFSAAALHTILVASRAKGYLKTSFVLTILGFILVLYSTFLTRSGVLGDTSVHSFVDPGRSEYIILLLMIAVFFVLGFASFFKNRSSIPSLTSSRQKADPSAGVSHNLLSRENALFLGAASLSVLSLFVLVGTSSPIITGLLQGKPTAVDSSYYVTTSLPLGILIIALIGLAQLLWWDRADKNAFRKNLTLPVAAALLTVIFSLLLSVTNIAVIVITAAAAFAFVAHAAAVFRVARGNPKFIGGPISHAALALMFIGIVASTALDSKQTVQLPQGVPVTIQGHSLTFTGKTKVDNKDAYMVQVKDGNSVTELKPVMYYSDYDQGTMREPDIKGFLGYDLYVSPVAFDEGNFSNSTNSGVNVVTLDKGKPTELADGTQLLLTKFDMSQANHAAMEQGGTFGVSAVINATKDGKTIQVAPELNFRNGGRETVPATAFGHLMVIMNMNVGMGGAGSSSSVTLVLHSTDLKSAMVAPVLTVEVDKKPLIGFLWVGTILLFIGLAVSMYRRFTSSSIIVYENAGSRTAGEDSVARGLSPVTVSAETKEAETQNVQS